MMRRDVLIEIGGLLVGQSIGANAATAAELVSIPLRDAGFTDQLEPLLDKLFAEKRVWNIHGIVILRGERLVLERYFTGGDYARGRALGSVAFAADTLHDLRSVSKSIVGLLYGIALADGKVPPPEAPLLASFPEYPGLAADTARARWNVHHALTMTMGIDWDELTIPYTDPANSEIAMDRAPDRYHFVLEQPVVIEPDTRWIYVAVRRRCWRESSKKEPAKTCTPSRASACSILSASVGRNGSSMTRTKPLLPQVCA